MARPIERIEKDIVELETAISAIALELQNAYGSYLEVLGQSVRQQLILAAYHLCTQGYPEKFLKLSLNRRQKLQQAMRKLAITAAEDMQALLNDDELEETEEDEDFEGIEDRKDEEDEDFEDELDQDDEDFAEIGDELDEEDEDFEGIVRQLDEDEDFEGIVQELEIEEKDLEEIAKKLEADGSAINNFTKATTSSSLPPDRIPSLSSIGGSSPSGSSPIFISAPAMDKDWKNWFNPNTSNPMELAAWQKNLERAIAYILKSLSRDGNRLLQKTGILPRKLPEPILEAAAAASSEAPTEAMPGPPNLINLVVEIQGEKQLPGQSLTQVMALNLRLVEIEFADMKLSSERKQIRNILNQLSKLGREYQKKQRERSVASAEAAWRSSWYED